jgi:hypothetical protein
MTKRPLAEDTDAASFRFADDTYYRFWELVSGGFSRDTAAMFAATPVALASILAVFAPDA